MRPLTFLLLLSTLTLATIHILALEFYLYWQYLWLDIPVHALGGAVVVLALFVLRDFGVPLVGRVLHILPILLIVLVIGIAWEYFEIMNGLTPEKNYWADTILDLIMDLMGGLIGYFVSTRIETLEYHEYD